MCAGGGWWWRWRGLPDSRGEVVRWSPCTLRDREPQIGLLACGLQGHQTSDPNSNLQQPQKGPNRACQGQLNMFITKEKRTARLTNDMFARWCKNTFQGGKNSSVINSECVWQVPSSPTVETKGFKQTGLRRGLSRLITLIFLKMPHLLFYIALPAAEWFRGRRVRLNYGPMFPFLLCYSINSPSVWQCQQSSSCRGWFDLESTLPRIQWSRTVAQGS